MILILRSFVILIPQAVRVGYGAKYILVSFWAFVKHYRIVVLRHVGLLIRLPEFASELVTFEGFDNGYLSLFTSAVCLSYVTSRYGRCETAGVLKEDWQLVGIFDRNTTSRNQRSAVFAKRLTSEVVRWRRAGPLHSCMQVVVRGWELVDKLTKHTRVCLSVCLHACLHVCKRWGNSYHPLSSTKQLEYESIFPFNNCK